MTDLTQWIEGAKQGEDAACERLIDLYLPKVFHFFCGMGIHAATAEDLTQEAFVEIWRALPGFQGRSSLLGWMLAICRRIGWRHLVGGKQQPEDEIIGGSEEVLGRMADVTANQESRFMTAQRNETIRQLVYQLPIHYREVVVLHYVEGMTKPAIAAVLEIAEGTVKSRLHRALLILGPKISSSLSE